MPSPPSGAGKTFLSGTPLSTFGTISLGLLACDLLTADFADSPKVQSKYSEQLEQRTDEDRTGRNDAASVGRNVREENEGDDN